MYFYQSVKATAGVVQTFSDPGAGQLVTCDFTLLQAMPGHKPEPTRWKLTEKEEGNRMKNEGEMHQSTHFD